MQPAMCLLAGQAGNASNQPAFVILLERVHEKGCESTSVPQSRESAARRCLGQTWKSNQPPLNRPGSKSNQPPRRCSPPHGFLSSSSPMATSVVRGREAVPASEIDAESRFFQRRLS